MLARDLEGALRTTAIVNQIAFDWPATEPFVHKLACCVILFAYGVMRGCLNWPLDALVISATAKRLSLWNRLPYCMRRYLSSWWMAMDIAWNKVTSALVLRLVHWLSVSCCCRIVASWRHIKGSSGNVLRIKFLVSLWLKWLLIGPWWELLLRSLLLMLILLSFNRKHHSSLILVLLLINLVFIIIVLSHEKAATTSLRTNISLVLSPIEVIRHCRSLVFSLPSCTFLNTESSITDSLVGGVDLLGSIISNSHSRACFHLENLLSHKPILLSKNINLVIVINHFLKLRIFFFED